MALKSIYDRNYKRVAILSNDTEGGINFYDDMLKTSIATGMYTFEFKVPKSTALTSKIQIGYYIETRTPQGKQLLMTITNIVENRHGKTILAEDCSINLINGFTQPISKPVAPQTIDYYVEHLLEGTGWNVKINQSTDAVALEFDSEQRILERLRAIAEAFSVELDFNVDFQPGIPPEMSISFLTERLEGKQGFRLSSDNLVEEIERTINMYNVVTAYTVKGPQLNNNSSVQATTEKTFEKKEEAKASQPTASVPTTNTIVEKAIAWAENIGKRRLSYQWGGNGNPSYDCSGFCQGAYQAAGIAINHRATTYSMWAQQAPFKRITRDELRRGDLIMYDTKYVSTIPNHVGIYLGPSLDAPNSVIHAGDPVGIKQRANSMHIIGYVRVGGS